MGASKSGAISLDDASSASATDAIISAIFWQPLFGGVMIGAEVDRMTSRFGESRVPKYGGLMAFPKKV
jgi:hypothetical protein